MQIELFDITLQAASCDQYKGRGYVLLEDYCYKDGDFEVWVPHSFFYDGASIPGILWLLLYSPFNPVVMEAALVHDWLYSTKVVKRSEADGIFRKILKDCGADWFRRQLMWLGVRVCGGFAGWPDSPADRDYMKGLYINLLSQKLDPKRYRFPEEFQSHISTVSPADEPQKRDKAFANSGISSGKQTTDDARIDR